MDEHQKRQVLEWFRTRVGPITCSVCSCTDFKFDSELTSMPVWRGGPHPRADFSDGVAAVMLVCTRCASVRLFSAAPMGILNASERSEQALPRPNHGSHHSS